VDGSGAINAPGNTMANVLTGNVAATCSDGGPERRHRTGGLGNTTPTSSTTEATWSSELGGQGIETVRSSIPTTMGRRQSRTWG